MRLPRFLTLAITLAALASGARAQSGPPPDWTFSVTPYAWLPALSGNVSTPLPRVGEKSFDVSSGTVLNSLDALPPMIAGEARYGRFSVVGDFFYAALRQDLDTRDLLWQSGHTRITSSVGTLLGMFRILEEPRQSIDIGAGTRIWNFGTKVSLNPGLEPGVIQKSSVSWADPLIAARYHATFAPRFGVSIYADVGGFDTGSRLTWQALGTLDYDVSDRSTMRVGWRYMSVDKKTGNVGINLGFNGPLLSATFRF